MRLLIVTILILTVSCSPQKRFMRLVKKHPELVKVIDTTVVVKDTLIRNSKYYYQGFMDSFKLFTDSVLRKSKYQISRFGNNFQLQVFPDTLFRTDTLFWEKAVRVPGKVIDLTPIWVKWISDHALPLAFIFLLTTLITYINSRSSGGNSAIRG